MTGRLPSRIVDRARLRAAALAAALTLAGVAPALAQLNGQNIKGDAGLKSGSQAPPGVYFAIPLWFYTADAVKGREGNEILTGNLDAAVFGVAVNVVTSRKILGANYGFMAALPWANNRVQGAEDLDSNPGAGLTDMYVQPINLGWHRPRADFTAAYGLYLPVGRYEDGADNNTGLGMWAQEILLGTTVYLNPQRTLHARHDGHLRLPVGEEGQRHEGRHHPQPRRRRRGGLSGWRSFGGPGLLRHLQADRGSLRRPAAVPAHPGQEPRLGSWPGGDARPCDPPRRVRVRHGALPVGSRCPHDDRRGGLEHPGDLPVEADSPPVSED